MPEGYYLDEKNRLRKVGQEKPQRLDVDSIDDKTLLGAMRHVAINDKSHDQSELEKTARQWKEKKPDDFMTRLWELEAEFKKLAAGEKGVAEEEEEEALEPTESDEELTEAINELLTKHAAKARK